jgi:phytanoyl-CoA hydroxylase
LDPYRDPQFVPKYRSQFGGLWTDLNNAPDIIQGKLDLGMISRKEADLLSGFIENGYAVFPGAVPRRHIRRLNEDIEKIWACQMPEAWISCVEDDKSWVRKIKPHDREIAGMQTKLLDLYEYSDSARVVMFNETIVRFLQLIFERPALAFQSLGFYRGSKQPIHRDTAFVRTSSPMELAASWIALEDVQEGSGELEYYPKSHLYPDFTFEGKYKWFPPGNEELDKFYSDLNERARAAGTQAVKFRPKMGDVFIWSADLAHGGSNFNNDHLTRKSLVVHYCPLNIDPMYYIYSGKTEKHRYKKGCYYTAAPKTLWRSGPAD